MYYFIKEKYDLRPLHNALAQNLRSIFRVCVCMSENARYAVPEGLEAEMSGVFTIVRII